GHRVNGSHTVAIIPSIANATVGHEDQPRYWVKCQPCLVFNVPEAVTPIAPSWHFGTAILVDHDGYIGPLPLANLGTKAVQFLRGRDVNRLARKGDGRVVIVEVVAEVA